MYLLRLATRPWRLSPLSQLFSSLAVGLLLFLCGFLGWMERELKPVIARLKSEQVITAYLDPQLEPGAEGKIVDTIRTELGAQASAEVKLVQAQDFVQVIREHYPELARELDSLGPDAATVIPRYVTVSGVLADSTSERMSKVQGVESVESTRDRYEHIVGAFGALRKVSRFLVVGLCLALLTGLIHLSRMNAYLHEDSLALMRLWGAGGFTLKLPSILSGAAVGVLGGGLAAGTWLGGGPRLAEHVRALSPMLREMPMPGIQFAVLLLGAGILIGVAAGVFGASAPRTAGR